MSCRKVDKQMGRAIEVFQGCPLPHEHRSSSQLLHWDACQEEHTLEEPSGQGKVISFPEFDHYLKQS